VIAQLAAAAREVSREALATSPASLALLLARHGALGLYLWQARRIAGWTRGDEALELARRCLALPGAPVVVEVGSFLGCSTVLLAGARRLRGAGRVHAVDSFDAGGDTYSSPLYRAIRARSPRTLRQRFDDNLRRAGVTRWVVAHEGDALAVAAGWTSPIDMLFLDGDQSIAGARATFDAWAPHLRVGGLLAVHNSVATEPEHDGSRVIVAESVRTRRYRDVRLVGSTTFAWKAGDG
jgi:predicted O-methyltransferase YrrM